MAANSAIEWTDHTFNPWRGCTKVHEGCAHCYAEREAKRFPANRGIWGPNGTRVKASNATWRQPLKWNREAEREGVRKRVFCASLADVFEDWKGEVTLLGDDLTSTCSKCGGPGRTGIIQPQLGPRTDICHKCGGKMGEPTLDGLRKMLFRLIDQTPWLDWLLLTKRPENVRRMWRTRAGEVAGEVAVWSFRPNVQLGTSISNQETADRMVPELLKCRDLCPVLFLSCEPLLGPIDLHLECPGCALCWASRDQTVLGNRCYEEGPQIDWVIVGGESGPGARPMHPDWVRSIRDQCQAAGVPFFFKQWGEFSSEARPGTRPELEALAENESVAWGDGATNHVLFRRVGKSAAGRLLDGREWSEFPQVEAVA